MCRVHLADYRRYCGKPRQTRRTPAPFARDYAIAPAFGSAYDYRLKHADVAYRCRKLFKSVHVELLSRLFTVGVYVGKAQLYY